jgi:hypothetical protein
LFLRFNSTLSAYTRKARHSYKARRYSNKTRRYIREHTGMSVAVAAAVTAIAGIGVASAVVGSAPRAEVAANAAAANYIEPGTLAGHAPSKPQTPPQPYMIYDSTVPYAVPAGQPVATYADGPFAVSPYQVAGHAKVLWIDTNGSDLQASALDVEPGDATPFVAAQWVQQKLTQQPTAKPIIYTSLGEWSQVQAAVSTLPSSMQSHVKYWIANPDGIPHMIPGAAATQWYWGGSYDISTAEPGFF